MDRDSEQLRILLVDDNADDRALARAILTHELPGAAIVEVSSALEFAQAFASETFSLAISEYELGWAPGSEILRSVKRHHAECATILFTREAAQTVDNRGLGADSYLQKSSGGFVALPGLVERTLRGNVSAPPSVNIVTPLWDRLPVGVFTLSSDGGILGANHAFARILEFPGVGDVAGRQFPDLLTDREARVELRHLLERNGSAEDLDLELRRNGHSPIKALLSLWPAPWENAEAQGPGPGGHQYQGMLIASEAQTDQAPRPARSGAEPTLAELDSEPEVELDPPLGHDQVTAALFGELQDPLQLLSQYARAIMERCAENVDEDGLEILERMQTVSGRVQSIMRGMLGYTASRRERTHPLEQVSLADILGQTLARLQGAIAESGAKIFADKLPTVIGDRELLRLMFRQLLDNSLKFRANEPLIVRISAEERANDWLLTIQDNGIGIPESASERVFEIFERLHDPDVYPGAGVGLSVCRYIASRHGGDIWVRPAQPHGCVFLITMSKQLQLTRPTPNPNAHGTVSEFNNASSQ